VPFFLIQQAKPDTRPARPTDRPDEEPAGGATAENRRFHSGENAGASGQAQDARRIAELSGAADVGVEFSHAGERLLVAGSTEFRAWDTRTDRPVAEPIRVGKEALICAAAISPDGSRVAIAVGTAAQLWDVATSKRLLSFPHDGRVRSVAFSPDGSKLLTAGDDAVARIWDAATGERTLERKHTDVVPFATFSPDGAKVLSIVTGNVGDRHLPNVHAAAYIWDARTGRKICDSMAADRPGDAERTRWHERVAFSPDSTNVAIVILGDVGVIDLRTEETVARTQTDPDDRFGTVAAAAFRPDGKELVTGGGAFNQGAVAVWGAASSKLLRTFAKATDSTGVRFSPDGKRVAAVLASGTAVAWDAATGKRLLVVRPHVNAKPGPRPIAFSPDGSRLVVSSGTDGPAEIWRLEPGEKPEE
jgi:DNA-binding beta-propeller fold protein YncE